METFENIITAQTKAQAHAQEIINTRVGGFGGSDAKLFLNIARKGVNRISDTDLKRIAQAMGLEEYKGSPDNAATRSGHLFEDEADKYLSSFLDGLQRETVMQATIAKNFKTFAHADFTLNEGKKIIECKFFAKKTTDETQNEVMAQLQWYFMLGAESVMLLHGKGENDPFRIDEMITRDIMRNDDIIAELKKGIAELDEAITKGWQPVKRDTEAVDASIKSDFDLYLEAIEEIERKKAELDDLQKVADAHKAVMLEYMQQNDIKTMAGEYNGKTHTCTLSFRAGSRTFDNKKFLAAHPEYDIAEFYKTGKESTSLTIK